MLYYRYLGSGAEYEFIRKTRTIKSKHGPTWFTPDIYESAVEARRKLALGSDPEFRVGPILEELLPPFDHTPLSPVPFRDPENPGGGTEAATTLPTRLPSFLEFSSGKSRPLL